MPLDSHSVLYLFFLSFGTMFLYTKYIIDSFLHCGGGIVVALFDWGHWDAVAEPEHYSNPERHPRSLKLAHWVLMSLTTGGCPPLLKLHWATDILRTDLMHPEDASGIVARRARWLCQGPVKSIGWMWHQFRSAQCGQVPGYVESRNLVQVPVHSLDQTDNQRSLFLLS